MNKKSAIIWGIVLWLVHLSMLTPLFSLTVWFSSIPAVILYVKTKRNIFAGVTAASLIIGALLSGPFAFVFLWIALTTLIPAVAMGEAYRRKVSARKAVTTGVVSYLAVFLLSILIATLLGGNLTQSISEMIHEGLAFMPESMSSILTEESIHEIVQLTVMMIPFYFIVTSALLAGLTHTVSRRICNRSGPVLPKFPPIRDWRLPRAFVWYYLIALFADLFVPTDDGSFLATVVVNIVPLFMALFAIQGLSFLFFIGYMKRKMWIPWLGVAAIIFITPLFSAFSLLGVFDTAFPIRDRFRKP